ncbi:MAG: 1,4-dihydroxy-2-naphthoate polyprenyltransferase, partial [Turicibacter sp.]
VASIIPFLFGTVYAIFRFNHFSLLNAGLMFIAMIFFDMTVTAINNSRDYKTAVKKEGFGYEIHNAMVRDQLNPSTVKWVIKIMFAIATLLGVLLFLKTDYVVLFIGVICFIIGILYSYGPIPISRTPFGELFSGLTMGFLLTFLSIYIHVFDQGFITLTLAGSYLDSYINVSLLLSIFTVTIPLITTIANIMLANNICDLDEDVANKRYTLPIHLGKETALMVFEALYIFTYASIIMGVLINILPITSLITLLTIYPVYQNIKKFNELQSKKETFVLSVKNFILINGVSIVALALAILFK